MEFNLDALKQSGFAWSRHGRALKFVAHVPEACEGHRLVMLDIDEQTIETYHENGAYTGTVSLMDLTTRTPQ